MGLIPELQKMLDGANARVQISQALSKVPKDPDSVSQTETTLTITQGDAELIAKEIEALRSASESPLLDIYRKNSLCIIPPTPIDGHLVYGSSVYQKLYHLMLISDMYKSDDIRRNIWVYIHLCDVNPDVLKETDEDIGNKVAAMLGEWNLACERSELGLNAWISEKKYQSKA